MAKAKKCDICGKLYEPYSTVNDPKKPNGLMFVNLQNNDTYWKNPISDCCPECMTAIKLNIDILKNGGETEERQRSRWIISSTCNCLKDSLLERYPFLNDFDIEEKSNINRYGNTYIRSYITINSLEDLYTIMKKADEVNPANFAGLIVDEIDGYMAIEIRDNVF